MEYIEIVLPDLEKVAGQVARKWPQVTSQEDLYQDLVVHFLERPGSLEKLTEFASPDRQKIVNRVAHQIASGQRDDLEIFSGQFTYSVPEVRKLAEKGAALNRVANFDAASIDFQESLALLKKQNRDYWSVFVDRYVNDVQPERNSAGAKVLERAVESLTILMNRARATKQYEFTNGGTYRNNKAALQVSDTDYEGAGRYDD